jgi:hypothetical protein
LTAAPLRLDGNLQLVRSEHQHHLGGDELGIVRQELAEVRARLARERVALALAAR